jgi:hypothetical protein
VSRNGRSEAKQILFACWLSAQLIPPACVGQANDSFLLPDQRSTASRVVVVYDSHATALFEPQIEPVRNMIKRGLIHLTGKTNLIAAWQTLISTQDIVGLKVYCGPGATIGTRPTVVGCLVESMLEAQIPGNHIVVWDKHLVDLKNSGMSELATRYGIAVEACDVAGYEAKTFYEAPLLGHLVWGDLEYGKDAENVGRKSFVSKLVTAKMTKIINLTPLLNHHTAGVCGSLFSLALGSVDNTLRFETDYGRLATAVPEIYALPLLGDRVVLNIVDALICQYQGEQTTLLHYSTTLNEIRFSKDPVALDVLSNRELEKQRKAAHMFSKTNSLELFQNASLLELGTSDPLNIRVEVLR